MITMYCVTMYCVVVQQKAKQQRKEIGRNRGKRATLEQDVMQYVKRGLPACQPAVPSALARWSSGGDGNVAASTRN
jgi:hypothetical protein